MFGTSLILVKIKTSIETSKNERQTVVPERKMFQSREKRSLPLSAISDLLFPMFETFTEFLFLIDALQFRNLDWDLDVRDAAVCFVNIELDHRNNLYRCANFDTFWTKELRCEEAKATNNIHVCKENGWCNRVIPLRLKCSHLFLWKAPLNFRNKKLLLDFGFLGQKILRY